MSEPVANLVAFLRARLDEDEAVALRIGDSESRWIFDPKAGYEEWDSGIKVNGATVASCNDSGEHIVRHDPARVLREVEAKRRLLEQFRLRGNSVRAVVKPVTGGVWDDLLRILALPYIDHPDCRPEWKP